MFSSLHSGLLSLPAAEGYTSQLKTSTPHSESWPLQEEYNNQVYAHSVHGHSSIGQQPSHYLDDGEQHIHIFCNKQESV